MKKSILILLNLLLLVGCSSIKEISNDEFMSKMNSGMNKGYWYNYIGTTPKRSYIEKEMIPFFSGPTYKTVYYVEHEELSLEERQKLKQDIDTSLENKKKQLNRKPVNIDINQILNQ